MYHTYFGIFNHVMDSAKRPMASVAYFKQEDPIYRYSLRDSAVSYQKKNIREFFGISLIEFLNLPITTVNELLEASEIIAKDKTSSMQTAINTFNSTTQ